MTTVDPSSLPDDAGFRSVIESFGFVAVYLGGLATGGRLQQAGAHSPVAISLISATSELPAGRLGPGIAVGRQKVSTQGRNSTSSDQALRGWRRIST
jgi:hypothetical protein